MRAAGKPRRGKAADATVAGIRITHPDREVFLGEGVTKKYVAEHYALVAPLMEKLTPDGIGGQCFFQRNYADGLGKDIRHETVTHKGEKHEYFYPDTASASVELAQMGAIEFHAWQSMPQSSRKPDRIIFDLDPDAGVPFDAVKLAAEDVRARLARDGLISFARLSGGKGVHIVAPIRPEEDWEFVKRLSAPSENRWSATRPTPTSPT